MSKVSKLFNLFKLLKLSILSKAPKLLKLSNLLKLSKISRMSKLLQPSKLAKILKPSRLLPCLIFFTALPSMALFEAKLSYNVLLSENYFSDIYSGTTPSMVPSHGLGGDLVFTLPLMPIGFGVRLENTSLEAENSGVSFKTSFDRKALLINYRLIDTLLYVGPTFTYGFDHGGSMEYTLSGTKYSFTSSSKSSYSIGLEVGMRLLGLTVGAELGQMNYQWKNAKNSVTSSTSNIDASGKYAKVLLGIGF